MANTVNTLKPEQQGRRVVLECFYSTFILVCGVCLRDTESGGSHDFFPFGGI